MSPKDTAFSMRFTAKELVLAKHLAVSRHKSMADLIREAVIYLASRESTEAVVEMTTEPGTPLQFFVWKGRPRSTITTGSIPEFTCQAAV